MKPQKPSDDAAGPRRVPCAVFKISAEIRVPIASTSGQAIIEAIQAAEERRTSIADAIGDAHGTITEVRVQDRLLDLAAPDYTGDSDEAG